MSVLVYPGGRHSIIQFKYLLTSHPSHEIELRGSQNKGVSLREEAVIMLKDQRAGRQEYRYAKVTPLDLRRAQAKIDN